MTTLALLYLAGWMLTLRVALRIAPAGVLGDLSQAAMLLAWPVLWAISGVRMIAEHLAREERRR